LLARGLHPGQDDEGAVVHPHFRLWGRGLRKVFLNAPAEIVHRVGYVESNPEREGKPRQHHSWVTPYDAPTTLVHPVPPVSR